MQHKQTIIYTGNFNVENMNAAGKRVLSNALIMKQLGYHLVMVGIDSTDTSNSDIQETEKVINDIESYHYSGQLFHKKRLNYIAFYRQLKLLLRQKDWNIVAIIGYNSPSTAPFIGKIQKYCHKRNIKYITDVADWLIVDSDNILFRLLRQADINLKNAYYSNRSDGVIAISTWLADYYKRKINNVIVIPPIAFKKHTRSKTENDVPQIVYAGIPFRKGVVMKNPSAMKDRFDIACDLLKGVKERGISFTFHVFGFTKNEILFSIPSIKDTIDYLDGSVIFHGMEAMEVVLSAVSNADYTILIRESNRMTTAGFPTKVSESVTCGTPVITTKTSDIERYLPEGIGAYYIDVSNKKESINKIEKLLELDSAERANQKSKCSNITSFNIESYVDTMRVFLSSVLV